MSSNLVSTHWWFFVSAIDRPTRKRIRRLASEREWDEGGIGLNTDTDKVIRAKDKSKRNSLVRWIIGEQWLTDLMWAYMVQANKNAGWEYDIDYVQDMQLTQYKEGMHYKWHYDGRGDHKSKFSEECSEVLRGRVRKLSLTLLLNEGYEGGHFEFTGYRGEKSKVHRPDFSKAGSIIVFPSHLEHRVTEVTKGTRNTLVAWFIGKPFR